jgi:GNAT superfamily N-acetyltransferase
MDPMTKKHKPLLEDDTPAYNVHASFNFEVNDGEDKPIAHVNVYERMAGLWVTDLWVKPDLRGKGLGRKVMSRMIEVLGDRDLFLNVHPYAGDTLDAKALIDFYGSFGFVMSGVNGIMFRRGVRHG